MIMDVPAWALSNLCIGRSYDSKTNQAGIDIFHPEIITKTENVNQYSFQYKFIESKKDVRDLLNISGGVSLKIKANIIKVEGTGKYINNSKQDKGVAEILAVMKYTTVNKTMDGSASAKQEMINSPGLGTHYVRSVTYGAEMVASLKFKSSSSSAKWNVEGKWDGGRDILGVAAAGLEAQLNKLISDFDEGSDLSIEYYATDMPDKNPTNLKDFVKLIQELPSRLKRLNDGVGVPIKIELQPIENVYPELGSVSSIQAMEYDLDEIESGFDDLTETQRLVSEYQKKGRALDGEMKTFNSLITGTLRKFRSAISSLDKKRVEECLEAYRTSLDGKDYEEKFATHWKEMLAKKRLETATSANVSLRGYESLYNERGSSSYYRMGKSDPFSGIDPLQSDTSANVSLRGCQSVYNEKEGSSRRMRKSDPLSGIDPQQGVSFTKAAPGGYAAHHSHVASRLQDLLLPETNQSEKKDLSIIGWEASQESLWAIFGLIDSYRDVLNLISTPKVLNCDVRLMKSYFEHKPSKYCVLVADGEKIKAVLTQEGDNILKLLQTPDRNVVERIILTICHPCSRPERDKSIVKSAIKAAFNDNKKVFITWFENGKLVLNENDLISFLTSSNHMTNNSPQEQSAVADFRLNDITGGRPSNSLSPSWNFKVYLPSGKAVLVLTRLRKGRISTKPDDVQYWQPGFVVPRGIVDDLTRYREIFNTELVILLDKKGDYDCQVDEKKEKAWDNFMVLGLEETVVLQTKLRNGNISSENKDLVIYNENWSVPQSVVNNLKQTYGKVSAADLFFASDSMGNSRCIVKVGNDTKIFTFISPCFNRAAWKK